MGNLSTRQANRIRTVIAVKGPPNLGYYQPIVGVGAMGRMSGYPYPSLEREMRAPGTSTDRPRFRQDFTEITDSPSRYQAPPSL